MASAPSSCALRSALVPGLAAGTRMAAVNMARPAIAAIQLLHKPSGTTTRAARVNTSATRNAGQERGLRCTGSTVGAPREMRGDAVVAAAHGRGDESEELFGLCAEGARVVGLMVQGEKALHTEMAAGEDFFVELGAKFLKILQAIRHGSSGVMSRAGARRP